MLPLSFHSPMQMDLSSKSFSKPVPAHNYVRVKTLNAVPTCWWVNTHGSQTYSKTWNDREYVWLLDMEFEYAIKFTCLYTFKAVNVIHVFCMVNWMSDQVLSLSLSLSYTPTHIHMHTHTHTHTHAHTHTHTQAHRHKHTHTCMHTGTPHTHVQREREQMNEWTLFHKGNGLDSGSFYIQPSPMRDFCYPTDNTHAQRTKNTEEEEKSKHWFKTYEIWIK